MSSLMLINALHQELRVHISSAYLLSTGQICCWPFVQYYCILFIHVKINIDLVSKAALETL